MLAVNCNVDIDRDGVKDCLAAGRMGVSVMNSHAIRRRGRGTHGFVQDVFAINCNVDIDRDGVKDWLAAGRIGVSVMSSHAIWGGGTHGFVQDIWS